MTTRKYRFQQIGINTKPLFADVTTIPSQVDAYGQSWIDVTIDDSQFDLLVQSMLANGYAYYETDPRIDIDVFAASLIGAMHTYSLNDDDTEIVVLETDITASNALRTVTVDYSYYLPTANRKQMGKILVFHDNSTASFEHIFSEVEGSEIDGLSFDVDISGTALRLKITTTSIGEEPTELILRRFGNYGGTWNTIQHIYPGTPVTTGLIFTDDIKVANNTAANNYIVRCNPTGGGFIVYVPISPSVGTRFGVKNVSASTNTITINGNGKLLDESAIRSIVVPYQWRIWQYNGLAWIEVDAGENSMVFTAEKSALYTAAIDEIVLANPTGGAFQVNAPAAPDKDDRFGVKNNSTSTNAITVSGNGHNIDGSASHTMNLGLYEWRIYQYDGSQWREVSGGGKELQFTSTQTADYTVTEGYRAVYDSTGGSFTIYAPATPSTNDEFGIKNITSDITPVTIDGNGKNIDGSATRTSAAPYAWRTWKYNGTQWNEIGD